MRRRLVVSTIAIVLVVLGTIAVPIGLIVYNAAERQIQARLETQVATVTNLINTDLNAERQIDLNKIRAVLGPRDGLTIIDPFGNSSNPIFPFGLESTRMATRTTDNGTEVIVITDADPLDDQFRDQLNILLGLAIGALLAAAALAAVQAHQLARPLERLAARAARIGDGDFSLQPVGRTHIPEIDDIESALDHSSQRVDAMLSNERHFTADATHQLRTGITGIAMRLEILSMNDSTAVVSEAEAALVQTHQLNSTIDELLAVTRNRSDQERTVFDLATLINDHVKEWQPRFNAVKRVISVITSHTAPPVVGTKGLAGQVVDILIDNALRHGAGTVTLMIDGPSVVVIDQGPGVSPHRLKSMFDGPVDPAARHGRGLALARRLAQVDGATLDVVGNFPLRLRYRLVRGTHSKG
jgi:signal transduction histidine kinase